MSTNVGINPFNSTSSIRRTAENVIADFKAGLYNTYSGDSSLS
ncbi:hypothetical protein tpqmel_1016, partial [Candidatus Gastranaerophilus sp. (ex Termes propinquus)]